MTFNEKIRDLATNGGVLPYIYGTPAEVDYLADKLHKSAAFPMVVHVTSIAGKLTTIPMARDEQNILIGFADKMKFQEFKEGAVQAKVDALKELAFTFLGRLNEDGYFEPVTDASYSVTFDEDSANLVMVMLDITLREAVGHCVIR